MKKLLLIRTVSFDSALTRSITPPLGLMYLASAVRKEFGSSYNLRIVDMGIEHIGIKAIKSIISEFSPDIAGCSVCSEEDECMHKVAAAVKEVNKDCKVIVGGPHPTMYFQEILQDRNIDIAIVGEGERTLIELLKGLDANVGLKDISGIAFYDNRGVVFSGQREFIENLDGLDFPAWDLIDIKAYSGWNVVSMNGILAGRKYMGIFTSRGCPYRCSYCHNIFGKRFRKRNAENVFAEIKELYDRYNVDEVHIYDDIFNLDIERVKKICDFIISSGMKIKFAFPNALRADLLDEQLIVKLKEAGTYAITFALETSSQRIQKLINKNINIERLRRIIDYSSRQGILTKCYFMIGFPGETFEEVRKTIDFACSSPLDLASFFIVRPQKGTKLFQEVKEMYPDYEPNFANYHYYAADDNYEEITGLPLAIIQRRAYRRFFLNLPRILSLLRLVPRKVYLLKCFMFFLSRNILPIRKI